ncbi:SPARC-related modular calcium-binding protein 1 isoform X2 [Chrysoperla carnea]|uniref:SPARC-related modular calcium-binding protein 1 isoform X2 n=1 Tax=Chrysoperla carnea TaxID=189513 RepID=UPI001D06DB4F|nr:SPARC-related modular calcium-binding protein 1 isoform X2 [Chrysoperla carnea]
MTHFATMNISYIIVLFFGIVFHWYSVYCTELNSTNDCMTRADECLRDPANNARGPICGTDNHTYRSICSLLLAQCQNPDISKQYDGQCNDPQPCLQSLRYAQSRRNAGITGLYIPRCRPDGMYAAVQCRDSGGTDLAGVSGANRYCWCVTPEGKAVPNTTARTGRPHCGHHKRNNNNNNNNKNTGKAKTTRRYSRGGRKQRQGCKLLDKRAFNSNLIKIFKSEWQRELTSKPEQRSELELDRIVLDWKFTVLDRNSNDNLEISEYVDFKRIVKKNVKPKRCARQFTRTCDTNKDHNITRQEWIECLSRNAIDVSLRVFLSLNADSNTRLWSSQSGQSTIDDLEEEEDIEDTKPIDELRHPRVLQSMPTSESLPAFSEDSEEPPMEGDCLYERKSNEQQSANLFAPECTPDGRYKTVQCYSDYCWCANADNGKGIPGTIVKGSPPKCDHISASSRTMKGCPDNRKIQFLKELIDFFIQKLGQNKMDNGQKREEKAAVWSFNYFDKNGSQFLEKKEWKIFRSMVEQKKNLRHCGKKLPRYCDINGDKKITLEEWNNCLGVNNNATNSKPTLPRKKENPLESILKSD